MNKFRVCVEGNEAEEGIVEGIAWETDVVRVVRGSRRVMI